MIAATALKLPLMSRNIKDIEQLETVLPHFIA